jgi:hypothetical protein
VRMTKPSLVSLLPRLALPRSSSRGRPDAVIETLAQDDDVLPGSEPVSQQKTRSTRAAMLTERLRAIMAWLTVWINTSADAYAAAALYEHLSRLSDAELRRRGLSRSDLAREAMEGRSRQGRPTS